jgi:cell division protein FtsI/penicillin-binding protein 2
MSRRIKLLRLFFCIWFLLLLGRLTYWQVVKAEDLDRIAKLQYNSVDTLPAPRGIIKSSDGYPLVQNTIEYMAYVDPKHFEYQTAERLHVFDLLSATTSARKILDNKQYSDLNWLPIAHQISPEAKEAIEKLHITGLGFEPETSRMYLEGSSSAYITGFVGKDEIGGTEGYFGLEGYYNRTLSGKPGRLIQELDALSRPIVIGNQNLIPPQPGQNLITSIDRTVEYIAWKQLEAGLNKYQSQSGSVVVMDSHTGHILAMVSLPGYDPAHFSDFSPELYKNPIVSEGYEPGSTFKTIIMSSALDAGVVSPATQCDICTGPQLISNEYIRSYDNKYFPSSTMTDVILHSDNIGMVYVSRKLGKSKMLSYIRKFGFGKLTGVDIQEESTPELRPDKDWYDVDWATASFGQGIAVTRLQMVTAVNAIANEGQLIPPKLVTGLESDGVIKPLPNPQPVSVISPEAAAAMTKMMINGVEKGEVRYYRVPGYQVAGKTGTAQVPIAGHYDTNVVIASFIGFAPASNPKFTMLVTLKNPQNNSWGSTTAAPVWFNIAGELFRYFRIPPGL